MKKIRNCLLAFIIPLIICLVFLYIKGVLTNVECIFLSDLRNQHLPFLSYMKNIMLGHASLFYTFSAGIGNPMLATMIFYCISPINLLLLVIKDINYAILAIYVTKVCLSGLTMYILLRSKAEKDTFVSLVFSTCYAISAFVINYFFCVFWFDSLYFAPLVILGIDKIYKTGKINLLYIISLALAIICNIQMGFGLCVFSVVYYLYTFNTKYSLKKDFDKFKKYGIIYAISSLCAGAIASGLLVAFVYEYSGISVAREIQVSTRTEVSNFIYILKNMLTVGNLKTDYYNNYEPYTYCGLIVTFFFALYLFNKKIDKKKRVHAFLVFMFFGISFCIRFLNLFWHLSDPILLNYRYSIYLGLFMTMIAHESYLNKDRIEKGDYIVMSILVLLGLFMMIAYPGAVYELYTFIYLILIFVLIVLAKNKKRIFEVLLFILVFSEIGLNAGSSMYTAYDLPYGQEGFLKDFYEIASWHNFEDEYRVMYNYSYTDATNDTLLLNKGTSLRYFSSVINGHTLNFFNRNVTTMGNNNYRVSVNESPLILSLLGNKYFYVESGFANDLFKLVETKSLDVFTFDGNKMITKNISLYENPYALTLGYVVDKDVKYQKDWGLVDYQNAIIKAFTSTDDDVSIKLSYTYEDANRQSCRIPNSITCREYTITNPTNNPSVYVYTIFDSIATQSGDQTFVDQVTIRPFVINSTSSTVKTTIEFSGYLVDSDFSVATYDKDVLIRDLSLLQENMVTDVKIDKATLTGKIDSKKDGILFLSIPYEPNFEITVDGKKVDYYPMLDQAFIGLDITTGAHDIKITYVNNKFPKYVIMSLTAIVVTFILYFVINKKITKKEEEMKRLEELALQEKLAKREMKKEKEKNKKKKK